MRLKMAVTAVLMAAFLGVFLPVTAQDSTPIWAGVYTAAQADRGRSVVQNHCGECHDDDLSGGEGPALAGSTFMLNWETHSIERLFHKIRDTMPTRESDDVTEQEKLDSVAYILQQNGFPAGSTELTDAAGLLGSIRILPKSGHAPPRAGALVRAIGCLQETRANQWALTQSSEPQVTTLEPLTAVDKALADAAAPGTQAIELLSVFPSPTALRGQKILVKGLFINVPSGARINVMSIDSIAPECGK